MGYDAPFDGLKVVDISQGVSGPYAGMLMAQYGASVVKVEPLEGEWGRFISRDYDKHSAFSVTTNLFSDEKRTLQVLTRYFARNFRYYQ